MIEIFKNIKDYEGLYQVSNFGRIRSLRRKNSKDFNILKYGISHNGYAQVTLYKDSNKKTHRVSVIVAKHFIKNINNKNQVNHKNGDKLNNHYKNLEWATAKENTNHADAIGLRNIKGTKHYLSKLTNTKILYIRKLYAKGNISQRALAIKYNVHQRTIFSIVNRVTWKHI